MANKNTKKKKQKGGGDDMPNIIQAILEMKVILFLPAITSKPYIGPLLSRLGKTHTCIIQRAFVSLASTTSICQRLQ